MKDTFLDQMDAPADLERGPEIIVDNFAGDGGASTGSANVPELAVVA